MAVGVFSELRAKCGWFVLRKAVEKETAFLVDWASRNNYFTLGSRRDYEFKLVSPPVSC
jgi:hypothetical protein